MRYLLLLVLALMFAGCTLPGGVGSVGEVEEEGWPTSTIPTPTPLATVTPGPVPNLMLPMLDGEATSLEAWRGKAVILNFWASWCYPCRTEMPALAEVHEAHEDVVVVGVNLEENEETARDFVEELALPFPILLDETGQLAKSMNVIGLPTTFFINAEGEIVGSRIGPLTPAMLAEIVEQLRNS